MAKRKNKHIFLVILGIVISLFLLHYFGVFDNIKSTFDITGGTGVPDYIVPFPTLYPSDTYPCPLTSDGCKVQGRINCTIAGTPSRVVYRASTNWIAWDWNNDGSLECFKKSETGYCAESQYCIKPSDPNVLVTNGIYYTKRLYHDTGVLFMPRMGGQCTNLATDIFCDDSSACNTAVTPQPGYEENEMTSGSIKTYNCPSSFQIFNVTIVVTNIIIDSRIK